MPAETRSSRLMCEGSRVSSSRTRCPTSGRWARTRSSSSRGEMAVALAVTWPLLQRWRFPGGGHRPAGEKPRLRWVYRLVTVSCKEVVVLRFRPRRKSSGGRRSCHMSGTWRAVPSAPTRRGGDMGLAELSSILWRERDMLELLLFKLEEEQLVLAAGR